MIEDTSFVIDVLAGDRGAATAVDDLDADRVPEKLSSVSVLELHEGIARANRPEEEKERVRNVIESKAIVPAGQTVMTRAGSISGRLHDRGEPIDREDCIVAATALLEDEPVLTRNVDHFERVPDLAVRTY